MTPDEYDQMVERIAATAPAITDPARRARLAVLLGNGAEAEDHGRACPSAA